MQTITLKINDTDAMKTLHALERKHLISIIDSFSEDSPSLPGEPLSISAFKKWIDSAEQGRSISLDEAKEKWAKQKNKLLGLSE